MKEVINIGYENDFIALKGTYKYCYNFNWLDFEMKINAIYKREPNNLWSIIPVLKGHQKFIVRNSCWLMRSWKLSPTFYLIFTLLFLSHGLSLFPSVQIYEIALITLLVMTILAVVW